MSKKLLLLAEATAVAFSIMYVILFTYGYEICWLFAFLASSIYLILCFEKKIYAESFLQLFYVSTAIYGWIHWSENAGKNSLNWDIHCMIILAGAILVIISGYLLSWLSDAASPYIDSFTTIFSIFATLLMIYLIRENWAYWIVIDVVSIFLYFRRKLYLTSVLFGIYTILSVNGLMEWIE